MIQYEKPEEFGMHLWILVCIICSMLEARGISVLRSANFCKSHVNDVSNVAIFLLQAVNQNVLLHFDELDALVALKDMDKERVDRFYEFWLGLASYLKEGKFIFCSGRQAWFQKVGQGKGYCRSPSGLYSNCPVCIAFSLSISGFLLHVSCKNRRIKCHH